MLRTLMWTVCFVLVLISIYWITQQDTGIDPALKSIYNNYVNANGALYDPIGSIGVKSRDDIGYEKKGSILYVTYGKQAFKVNLEKNINEATEYLKALGLIIVFDSAGDVLLKYHGEVVKQFE